MFVPFLFLVNSHMSHLVHARSGFNSGTGAYRVTILHIPDQIKNLQSTCDIQSIGFKDVFGSYSLCLRPFCRRVFCVHLHNLYKRIKTFEGCILNVWKCIHKEAIQVKNYFQIALLALEWGGGQ